MKHQHLKLALVACVALSACAERSMLTKPDQPIVQPGMGLVVASFGFVMQQNKMLGGDFPYIRLTVHDTAAQFDWTDTVLDTQGSKILGMSKMVGGWNETDNLIITPDSKRMLVAYPYKPGIYTVTRRSSAFSLLGSISFTDNPVTFEVKAGEITYIGSYELSYNTFKDFLGTTRPGTGAIAIKSRAVDDVGFLRNLRPELQALPVVNALVVPKR